MSENMNYDSDKTVIGGVGEATQMVLGSDVETTQFSANIECPVCHTPNSPSETYCIDCGFFLAGSPVAVEVMPEIKLSGKVVSSDGMLEFPLRAGENTVGRENTDVLLSHATVSRKHAKIIVEDGGVFVEDTGSTNGTYVGGAKIDPNVKTSIKDGSEITFGSFTLKFIAPEPCDEEQGEPEQAVEPANETDEPADRVEADSDQIDEVPEAPEAPGKMVLARLAAKNGSGVYDIVEGTNTIGRRDGANTIVISDPYCSGRHADLAIEDGVFTITDVGSTNGTLVNGVKIKTNTPRELHSGDEITLGSPVFKFEVDND